MFDPVMMLFDLEHMKSAVSALAEFHGLCIAYDILSGTKMREKYPIFAQVNLMWFQDDMLGFINELIKNAKDFLERIPGEQETAGRLAAKFKDPKSLFISEMSRSHPFRCFQHGDSWHNNFLFHKSRRGIRSAIVDWQVSFYGSGPFDLCYLICSSSTGLFRRRYMTELVDLYYDVLLDTMRSLQITTELFNPSREDLQDEVDRSLALCLLFCGNSQDLKIDDGDESGMRRPSVATDAQVFGIEDPLKKKSSEPRVSRAIRRRNFLDLCREALRKNVI